MGRFLRAQNFSVTYPNAITEKKKQNGEGPNTQALCALKSESGFAPTVIEGLSLNTFISQLSEVARLALAESSAL